jgi:2-polyprenyl-3-methyl-5-hydroxy-6-metoxy-1,4-benzoquinol methylase
MSPASEHFDGVAADYDHWKHRARYYYSAVKSAVAEIVPPGRDVLEVGCGTGDVLASLRPTRGLGIDISRRMVSLAASKHPALQFKVHDLASEPLGERFPFVVAVDVAEHVEDLAGFMRGLSSAVDRDGRVVVVTANPLWGQVLHAAERLRLKMPEGPHEWRSRQDLMRAASEAGLKERSFDRSMLVPKRIPVIALLNRAPQTRGLRQRFGLIQRAVYAPA